MEHIQEVLVDPWKRHCFYAQIKRVQVYMSSQAYMFRGMHLMQSPNVVLAPNTQSNCFHFGMQSIRKKNGITTTMNRGNISETL